MTVETLKDKLSLEVLALPEPDAEINGAYAGDLLSWVMGRASEGNVWATIMTNMNVVAVATLAGTSAVIICENSEISEDVVDAAKAKGINLLRCAEPMYETCVKLSKAIN